jgi:hypothetical protein
VDTYHVVTPWLGRHVASVKGDTVFLRSIMAAYAGRRAAHFRQIGANSFLVTTKRGWPLLEAYRV